MGIPWLGNRNFLTRKPRRARARVCVGGDGVGGEGGGGGGGGACQIAKWCRGRFVPTWDTVHPDGMAIESPGSGLLHK